MSNQPDGQYTRRIADIQEELAQLQASTRIVTTAEEMVEQMKPLLDLDVRIIGGCCGTNPEYLKQIATMVKGA